MRRSIGMAFGASAGWLVGFYGVGLVGWLVMWLLPRTDDFGLGLWFAYAMWGVTGPAGAIIGGCIGWWLSGRRR